MVYPQYHSQRSSGSIVQPTQDSWLDVWVSVCDREKRYKGVSQATWYGLTALCLPKGRIWELTLLPYPLVKYTPTPIPTLTHPHTHPHTPPPPTHPHTPPHTHPHTHTHTPTHLHKVSPWSESIQCIALLCSGHIDHLSTVLLSLPVPANVVLQDDTIGELWWHQCDGDEVSEGRRGEDGGGPYTRHWERRERKGRSVKK